MKTIRTSHSGLVRICFLALLCSVPLYPQQAPFLPITAPSGPKGAGVLFQDSHGGLWVGGNEPGAEGLIYFDGSRFFSPVEAFPKMSISGMAEDSEGGIWLAAAGVYRLYRGRLEKLLDGTAGAGITEIAPDVFLATVRPSGRSLTNDAALVRIDRENGKWRAQTLVESFGARWLRPDHQGNILYRCPAGFCELPASELAQWRPGIPVSPMHYPMRIPADISSPTFIFRDRRDCVWVRTEYQAAYRCPGDPDLTTLPASVVSLVGPPQLLELNDGSLVIPSFSKVAIGRPEHFRVLSAMNGFPNTGFALVARDQSLWFSNANGLFVLPTYLKMEFWNQQEGLDGNTWSILPMPKKTFAIAGDAIQVLDDDRSRWRPLLDLGGARHLSTGPRNTIFVASQSSGVVQIASDGKILRRSQPASATILARTPDGEYWVSGTAVSRMAIDGNKLSLHPVNLPPHPDDVTDLKISPDGTPWACTGNSFLRGDPSGWHIVARAQGQPETPCLSFALDRQGTVWHTYSDQSTFSLFRILNGKKPVISQFPNSDESGPAMNYFFESDSRGWLWRGTPRGIYVATSQQASQSHWLLLNRKDGLPAIDANQRSFLEDEDGSVWFGVDDSIVHLFPPPDLLAPQSAPQVFLSGLSWNGQTKMFAALSSLASGSAVVAHIGSMQFDRRNALRIRYRLLPDEQSWTDQEGLDIPLGKLAWGNHTLEVQGRLFSGPWSPAARQSFMVLKPVWFSPLSIAIALALVIFLAVAIERQRKRQGRSNTAFPDLTELRFAALSPEVDRLKNTVLDGRFEVGDVLARGGFATVAKGRDLRRGNDCAVKIFRQRLSEKAWLAKRFQQEVLALEKIRHPNVVEIYGHGTTPAGAYYIVMEFIHGRTLRSMLNGEPLPFRKAASYLRQTGMALEEIHKHGICHRDLKPENLMIRDMSPHGQELVLIDFSIAIVKDPDETVHGLTHAAGTLSYMAPEQAIGYAEPASDIYSLAKVTIEMLTGRPLSALVPEASMDIPHRLREILLKSRFNLSASSIDTISTALEFDPARRPKNALEFAASIAQDLESHAPSRSAVIPYI